MLQRLGSGKRSCVVAHSSYHRVSLCRLWNYSSAEYWRAVSSRQHCLLQSFQLGFQTFVILRAIVRVVAFVVFGFYLWYNLNLRRKGRGAKPRNKLLLSG